MTRKDLMLAAWLGACGLIAGVAGAATFNAPCPVGCPTTPGGKTTRPIDTTEAEYTCCNTGGACVVCDDCPWYLEIWC